MNRLAYSPFNKDEPRTVVELAKAAGARTYAEINTYVTGYSQAAEDAAAEITRLNAELKLAYKKIQELR